MATVLKDYLSAVPFLQLHRHGKSGLGGGHGIQPIRTRWRLLDCSVRGFRRALSEPHHSVQPAAENVCFEEPGHGDASDDCLAILCNSSQGAAGKDLCKNETTVSRQLWLPSVHTRRLQDFGRRFESKTLSPWRNEGKWVIKPKVTKHISYLSNKALSCRFPVLWRNLVAIYRLDHLSLLCRETRLEYHWSVAR